MTPPFQPGDRVTVRYNKPLGEMVVKYCERLLLDTDGWYCACQGDGCKFTGPATSLIKVQDKARREA